MNIVLDSRHGTVSSVANRIDLRGNPLSKLRLALLGPPLIDLNGKTIKVKRRKAVALLAYLAVTGHEHSRSSLATLFWPEYDESRALAYLRQTLWTLKSALAGQWVDVQRDYIAVQTDDDYWLDVDHFRRMIAESRTLSRQEAGTPATRITPLMEATALYRDDFLTGFSLRDSPDFDKWHFFQSEKLRRDLASGLERLVAALSTQRDFESAIAFTQRWLTLDPLHEPAHRTLMNLYAHAGQRSAALHQYQECEQVLALEIGVRPLQETTQLYQAILENRHPEDYPLSGDLTTAPLGSEFVTKPFDGPVAGVDISAPLAEIQFPASIQSLPAQPTPFIGREEELTEVIKYLHDPNCRLLTLIGPGGIGKTRLALQTAQEVQSQYPDGVFFIPLAALSSENFLVYTISNALQLSFYQRDDPKVLLLDYLRGKQMLLVLDNFEHLIAGGGLLAEVLAHAPEIKMMTTSRIRLGLRGEWIFEVKGLKFPQNGDYKGEQGFSAVELFLQTAQRVRPGFSPSRADLRHTIQICRLLEGMPLGIELAAAWVRMLPCQEIAQEIEQNLDFLTTSLQDLPERHQSLRAVFDHSWHLLAEEEQRVFKMLSVFRGGFQRIAAQLIAGASPNLLLGLMDKSLINHTTTGRYEMHELLRQYAVEHLAEKPTDKVTAHDLHSQYYATFLQERADDLRGGRQKQAVEEIVTEIENVRRGWRWAIEQWRTEEIVKYLDGLYIFFELRGWFREGEETFSLVEDELQKRRFKDQQADPEDKNIIAKQLARQGGFSINLGDYEKAGELLEDSMAEFRRQEAHGEIGFCLFNLGDLARRRGDYQAARHLLEESVSVLGTAGEPRKLARALNMLGIVTASVGGYAEATQLFRASIARLKELGDLWGVGKGLNNLGIVTYYFEQYQEAQDLYQESLQINREIGDDHGVAIALNNLGLVAHELGAYEDAQDLHNESLEIFSKTGYSLGAGNCLNDLGKASLALGDYEQAKDYLIRALRIAQEIQALPLGMSAITGIGFLHMEEGDYAGALALLVSVVEHPASDQDTKDRAEQLLPKLETQLTAEAISQAKRRGKALDYVKIMEEFLNPPQ